MSDKLPDKIIPISTLRIIMDKNKKCTCRNRKFYIDTQNREISCQECGAIVHPYNALFDIAMHYERIEEEVNNLLAVRQQIVDYKPHLLAMRELEKIYRRDMLPSCPHCHKGIYAKELLISGVSKKHEEQRRLFAEKAKKEENQ